MTTYARPNSPAKSYQYTKDKDWLRRVGYPVVKSVAMFYWNYLEKYQERFGGDIFPSSCLENNPIYRNIFQDLLFFRFAFRVAAALDRWPKAGASL
ncbi:MAG: hypothetical protein EXR62_16610 [Chloroflexi bacterium]|nr:hypothetical protein [Chloroflexota bacterium]